MDEQRLFLLSSLQRARTQTFDGPKYEPWARPGVHSLPPVPDKPKKAAKATPLAQGPMSNRPNMVLATTPDGKAKWVLAPKIVEEVRSRLIGGDTAKTIANTTGLSFSTISRVAQGLREEAVANKPVSQQQYQEPPRTFVIDWKSRLAAIEYSDPPAGCLPRKMRKRVNGMTRGQMAESLRSHGVTVPLAINCAAPGHPVRPISERPVKPLKTGQKGNFFVGGDSRDVESTWRNICTA